MSPNATLRWASVAGTLMLAALSWGAVATGARPAQAPLHPSVKVLASDAGVQSNSYVS